MTESGALSDGQLVEGARGGSHEAYRHLVTRYQGHVYGLAYSITGNWADAQDIAQETFIRAYTHLDQLREAGKFAAWLRRVTFSIAMAWVKAHRPKLFQQMDGKVDLESLEIPDFAPGPAEAAERRELADAVLAAVASLPTRYRVPLTMFHLDGLSYQKVADFLDIPLGTAKSLISRAQAKLKEALAATLSEEVTPVVQEVFNEHKLPAGFASKVLENIPPLKFEEGDCTLAGAVLAAMRFLGQDVTYAYVMGVSGGAFRLLWHRESCPSAGDLQVVGDEPLRRAFAALGYAWRQVRRTGAAGEEEAFRRAVTENIDAGRPVLVSGVVGPPELGIITGYEEGGKVILGRSYFQNDHGSYYRMAGWYSQGLHRLILLGEPSERPARGEVLGASAEWGVSLARTASVQGGAYACGLAAYDAWAAALERDEDFPPDDIKILTARCNAHASVVLCDLADARRAAAAFLSSLADARPSVSADITAAAGLYSEEAAMLREWIPRMPYCWEPEERRRMIADGALRRGLAGAVREAKAIDLKAVERLEAAIEKMA